MSDDDFTPVTRTGDVERSRRLLGFIPRQPELPACGPYERLVLFDRGGHAIDMATAGQRMYGDIGSYAIVDTSPHDLTCRLPQMQTTIGAFDVAVDVEVCVTDVLTAAMHGSRGVRQPLTAALKSAVRGIAAELDREVEHDRTGDLLNAHERIENVLATRLQSWSGDHVLPWLTAKVQATDVTLDSALTSHLQQLQGLSQRRVRQDYEHDATVRADEQELERRQLLSQTVRSLLMNPGEQRLVEAYISGSPDQVQAALSALDEDARADRRALLETVNGLFDRKLIDEVTPEGRAILDWIRHETTRVLGDVKVRPTVQPASDGPRPVEARQPAADVPNDSEW